MEKITGLIGRDELVKDVVREIKKGKHVVLTGPVGIGKSAVLQAALKVIEPHESEWRQFDRLADEADAPDDQTPAPAPASSGALVLVYLSDHQAKGQFVQMARRLIETGVLSPSSIDLAKELDELPPEQVEWTKIRRQVNRLSIRDLSSAIIPAIYGHAGQVLIAVDDMTRLTPTQQAFWLAVFDHAQVVTCASERKSGLRKLWWKMKEIEVPRLEAGHAKALVKEYTARKGVMIESPELYVGHVVKQAGGNPQAIYDMLDESSKERVVDKRQIREMRHQAGVRYVDFTPAMIIVGALVVATRYIAIGLGDKSLYILAGIGAALFLSVRFFMFKGAGKASG
ncbi:MAG: ATP-binding protein [Chromatiaceae bacterium]|nr:ATP-binding protein [Caldilineaceae bacterium]MCP5414337.1 ATP-binding protein [Chromatiaceae bacterium]